MKLRFNNSAVGTLHEGGPPLHELASGVVYHLCQSLYGGHVSMSLVYPLVYMWGLMSNMGLFYLLVQFHGSIALFYFLDSIST